jgi:hypothetical protein
MSSKQRYTRHKLASFLIVLTLALSFVLPAYAQDTTADEDSAYVPDDQATVDANRDADSDFDVAHSTGCATVLTIDQPTNNSSVTGVTLISGWALDTMETLAGGIDAIDIYRGDTFIGTTATAASRDVGNVRPDVDSAMARTDARSGWFYRMDWSREPGGSQTYRVLARSHCEWTEARFTVNVNPAPPAPSASLSIDDQSRTLGTNTSTGLYTTCISYEAGTGRCLQYGSSNSGTTGIGNCPAGYYWNGSQCIYNGSTIGNTGNCPAGYYWNGVQCTYTGTNTIGIGTNLTDVNFDFTVTLSPASTQTVTVNYNTVDGSAVSTTDYTSTSGTLTFAPGETTKTITVRVYNRGITNSTRDFIVRLSNPSNAGISKGDGRGTIRSTYNTTTGCAQYDVNGNCISYSNTGIYGTGTGNCPSGYYWNGAQCIYTGTTGTGNGSISFVSTSTSISCVRSSTCNFTIQQSGGVTTATVSYTVNSSTATAGAACGGTVDVAPASGSVSVSPNSTAVITLATCVGSANSVNEMFTVVLSSTTSGFLTAPSSATGTFPSA